jgi:PKD repeat protein
MRFRTFFSWLQGRNDLRGRDHRLPPSSARRRLWLEHLESRVLPSVSLWDSTITPATPSADDANAVEVGVKFQSDVAGTITGIKFYKGAGNTGTHVGHLWANDGTLLATATFTGESATGWQEIDFTTPVNVSANTVYVVSYHTNTGHYADDEGFFATGGVDHDVLHALADGVSGPNGVYAYGPSGSFPNLSWEASNYYVDVVFNPTDGSLVANAGPAKSTNEGGAVTFAGSVTGGTGPFTYAWDFGDNTTDTGSLTPTHTYANHGTYTATFTVTDALNQTSTSTTTVTVNDVAPTAHAGGPYNGTAGAAISFTGSATDPGANDVATLQYLWNFGDNTTSTLQNPTHTYANAGSYTVTLKVTEASGLSSTDTTTASVSSGNTTGEPLLTASNLEYLGAFRLPGGTVGASTFDYGGTALAFNPANNSLFIVGHDWYQNIAEVSIPSTFVDSGNVRNLPKATVLQPLTNVMSRIPNNTLSGLGTIKIGGLQVINNQLVGTLYAYYDGAGAAVDSHFTLSSLNLSTAQVQGLYKVGNLGGGFVGGWMGSIPSEWQSALGASYFTGQGALSIISRTSSGPAMFGFDPTNLTSGTNPDTPYVYYPLAHPLANIAGNNPIFNGNTEIKGAVFVPGSKTVLFFGDTGTNTTGYGEAATFNDSNRTGKGWHSQNGDYAYEVWAYNVDDLIAAKNGTIQPWQVKPYSTWNIDFPNYDGGKHIGGVAFDPQTMRLYVSQEGADKVDGQYAPLIQVFQLNLDAAGAGGQIGSLTAGSVASGVNGAYVVSANDVVTLTANNVTDVNPGSSIAQVLFYLDQNGDGNLQPAQDTLLGSGTQSGSTWTLNVAASSLTAATPVTRLPAGTYRVFAVAQDSDGLSSDPVEIILQVA